MLDTQNPRQGYGQINLQLVSIVDFDFAKSNELKKFLTPLVMEDTDSKHKL